MSETTTLAPNALSLQRRCVKMWEPMPAEATPNLEEERLVADLRARDPAALRELYERFGRITFGFLVKTLRDRGAAEDVQQQVFLEAWRRAESFDPERGRLLTWLMTIARSRAIDHARRRLPEPVDPQVAARSAEAPSGEGEIDALAAQWQLRALLDRLPAGEAALLRLRFYDGLSQSEIAARDGIPLGTVKTRMVSGLRRLREMIEEENGR
jgi:RNA polymerase sigma-70 factor (ECF subfamily)